MKMTHCQPRVKRAPRSESGTCLESVLGFNALQMPLGEKQANN